MEFDELADRLAEEYIAGIRLYREAVMKPLFGEKLSRGEQIARYLQMRDDQEAWLAFIAEHGELEARRMAAEMEARLRRGLEEE